MHTGQRRAALAALAAATIALHAYGVASAPDIVADRSGPPAAPRYLGAVASGPLPGGRFWSISAVTFGYSCSLTLFQSPSTRPGDPPFVGEGHSRVCADHDAPLYAWVDDREDRRLVWGSVVPTVERVRIGFCGGRSHDAGTIAPRSLPVVRVFVADLAAEDRPAHVEAFDGRGRVQGRLAFRCR